MKPKQLVLIVAAILILLLGAWLLSWGGDAVVSRIWEVLGGEAGNRTSQEAGRLARGGKLSDAESLATLSAAQTARAALLLAWFQFVIGIAGMVALLFSLREGRRASTAALTAVQTERQVQRAHLTIESASLEGSGADSRLKIDFKNTGLTPALLQQGSFHLLQAEKLPAQPAYTTLGAASGTGLVPAGEQWEQTLPSLRDEGIEPDGKTPVWVYGLIDYNDVFGEKHDIHFCYRLAPNGSWEAAGASGIWWRST